MQTSTTFGYDEEEDRIWVNFHPESPRVWLTRRFVHGLIVPLTQLVERHTTGAATTEGLSAPERTRIEHQIAMSETPSGEAHYPFRLTTEDRQSQHEQGFVLCNKLGVRMLEGGGCNLTMNFAVGENTGEVNFGLSRYDIHLWLRALRMAMDGANWNNTITLPEWLTESALPPQMQSILKSPIPADIQAELDEPDPNKPPPKT